MGLSASYERFSEPLDATNLHIDSPQMVSDPDRTQIYSLGLREKNPDRRVVGIENESPAVLKKTQLGSEKIPHDATARKVPSSPSDSSDQRILLCHWGGMTSQNALCYGSKHVCLPI